MTISFDGALRARVRAHLDAFPRRAQAAPGRRPAAVAVLLSPGADGRAGFLLTRRAAALRTHARQWALPGGRLEPGERPVEAALRELREEVGLELGPGAVLGLLDDYPTRSGFVVTPVVLWGEAAGVPTPDPAEVAGVYHVPLEELERPDLVRFVAIPESSRPLIQLALLGSLIHAPTAAILYQFREVALYGRPTRVDHFEQPVWAWR
jgi:8-oxo-dGTP pyrophosphatase MutT (NUDIX family)